MHSSGGEEAYPHAFTFCSAACPSSYIDMQIVVVMWVTCLAQTLHSMTFFNLLLNAIVVWGASCRAMFVSMESLRLI